MVPMCYSTSGTQWHPGLVVPKCCGTRELLYPSAVVLNDWGTKILWYHGTRVLQYQWYSVVPSGTLWYPGTVVPKFCGTQVLLYPSTVVSKACGAQKMWYHGTQWYRGTQIPQYLWYPVMPSGTTDTVVPSDTMVSKYFGTMYF